MALDDRILEQATAWAVRTGDPSFEDWDGFTAWLESNPAHARAYDAVALSVADALEALPPAPAPLPDVANDDVPASPARRRWLGGGMALALTAVAVLGVMQFRGTTYAVETAPGETRIVQLEHGGQMTLAGGSRVTLDRDNAALAVVEQGQALFHIQHDGARPFRVKVGANELLDIGTVFDVRHIGGNTTVAVSEGAVVFNPGRQNVRINPGFALTNPAGSAAYRLTATPVAQVGEWSEGRLTFQDADLAQVAEDLSRATGKSFRVGEGTAARRVTGSLLVDPVRADPASVGPLLDVAVSGSGDEWVIGAQ